MKVSFIIPTFNCAELLKECLESIDSQEYPKEEIEIIIADGGSSDQTLEVAKHYTSLIFTNPLKTGEAGKAVGIKHAKNEILAFVDSDNILPQCQWLAHMLLPFQDAQIIASEPLYYTYRKEDHFITRYCALIGMNDPLCHFLGNYDRFNMLAGQWTDAPIESLDQGIYYKISFLNHPLPTIGANGFFIRKTVVDHLAIGDYFMDIDILPMVAIQKGLPFIKVAKVKDGIIHIYCRSIQAFAQKQKRRIQDFLYFSHQKQRQYPWSFPKSKIFVFIIFSFLIIPLFLQSLKGFFRKKDIAWFFHPLACWITLYIYGLEVIKAKINQPLSHYSREDWHSH